MAVVSRATSSTVPLAAAAGLTGLLSLRLLPVAGRHQL
jgi:tetrahydromethanopterin S-methyltransferase subunit D